MRTLMISTLVAALAASAALAGCSGDDDDDDADAAPAVETLVPDPAGAPADMAEGRLTCVGDNAPDEPSGGVLEITGYARTFADPSADQEPPQVKVEAFTSAGIPLGDSFSDVSKDGRVAVSIPITGEGFTGYTVATTDGYAPWRFFTSRPITTSELNGWSWLVTAAEIEEISTALGVTVDPAKAIIVGAVHDCDSFGVPNVMVQVNGSTSGVYYLDGFDPSATATYSAASGRFIVPNVDTGEVVVKAFARLPPAGGDLTLLSSRSFTATADGIMQVALEPRVGSK